MDSSSNNMDSSSHNVDSSSNYMDSSDYSMWIVPKVNGTNMKIWQTKYISKK